MSGLVTQTLAARIRKQVEANGLVVWYDPERIYADAVAGLDLGGAAVERFETSVFELRKRLEPYLGDTEPPQLVVYIPEAESKVGAAFCEIGAAGVVMRPGKQPPVLNTRLAVIARTALKTVMGDEGVEAIVKQAESGQLSLADLDSLAEQGKGAQTGALSVVFETANAPDVALRFLHDPSLDDDIGRKGAAVGLADLLALTYGVDLDPTHPLEELRSSLARYLFVTEIHSFADGGMLEPLREVPHAPSGPLRAACVQLVTAWRNRRDLAASYLVAASRVEEDLGLAEQSELDASFLTRCETVRAFDELLYQQLEERLLDAADEEVVSLAEDRQAGFWATVSPDVMERWALLAAIGRVRVDAVRLSEQLRSLPTDAEALVRLYRDGSEQGSSWASLDGYQRHMERRFHHFDLDHTRHTKTEKVVTKARDDYARAAGALAEAFGKSVLAVGLRVSGVPRQVETFGRFVEPHRKENQKVGYLLVDGLRFEMAEELARSLGDDIKFDLTSTLGTLPSITEVGMAALMPRADQDPVLEGVGSGKLALRIGEHRLRGRKDRMAYLAEYIGDGFEEVRLDAILPPRGRLKTQLKEATFACVTATEELDGLCEKGNVAMARRLMDDVLLQVRRGVRVLFDLGFEVVVITADHGFLFGEVLDEGSKIEAPGGKTADLHRRVWVGNGGAKSESTFRVTAKDVGLGGDLEIVVPKGIGAFKAKGASTAYFHGGASPQELVVPVLTVRPGRPSTRPSASVEWGIHLGTRSVSALAVTATITGQSTGLFGTDAPLVRVEVRDGRKVISRTLAASYGLEETTGLVQLRPLKGPEDQDLGVEANTVTLLLEAPKGEKVRLVLVDANTEKTLAKQDDLAVEASIRGRT